MHRIKVFEGEGGASLNVRDSSQDSLFCFTFWSDDHDVESICLKGHMAQAVTHLLKDGSGIFAWWSAASPGFAFEVEEDAVTVVFPAQEKVTVSSEALLSWMRGET